MIFFVKTSWKVNLVRDFYVENIHIKLQHDTGNLRKVIAFTMSYQMLPAWKFIKVTQRSRSNLVEILMSRTSLPVQLQPTWYRQILMLYHIQKKLQDAAIWTWPISKGQTLVNIKLVWDFDVENISEKFQNDTGNSCRVIVFTRQLDRELVWNFKNVT